MTAQQVSSTIDLRLIARGGDYFRVVQMIANTETKNKGNATTMRNENMKLSCLF